MWAGVSIDACSRARPRAALDASSVNRDRSQLKSLPRDAHGNGGDVGLGRRVRHGVFVRSVLNMFVHIIKKMLAYLC